MDTRTRAERHSDAEETVQCDVLVIGGGPAGSTAAALLAERGHDVLLLDKDEHPRFHIGESLLPANLQLFERLGVADEMRRIGMPKPAAEFYSPWHDKLEKFDFSEAWDKNMPHAYAVKRSEFDEVLLKHARKRGVRVIEQCRVTSVDLDATAERALAQARHADGRARQCSPRFVLDASGRDTFLANKLKLKEKDARHNSLAVYAHYSGVRLNPGKEAGNITIFWFEHGWFWFIPLQGDVTSVGMVCWPYFMKTRGERSLEQFLRDGIALVPALAERLAQAQQVRHAEATGNYSYRCTQTHGRNYALIGDAYCFIDPMFSSGVMMAMQGAFAAADAVHDWLHDAARQATLLQELDKVLVHGPHEFSWFIYRMSSPSMRDLFMDPRNYFRVKEALLSVLGGDIYGGTPIWRSVAIFKAIYYASCLRHLRRTLHARKRRQRNIASLTPQS